MGMETSGLVLASHLPKQARRDKSSTAPVRGHLVASAKGCLSQCPLSQTSWNQRFAALRNVPPVLRLVWDAAPTVVASGIALRLVSALIPVAMLAISKLIIDLINTRHSGTIPTQMWWLLGAEFVLAAANQLLGRTIDYTDARLADEFTREVSLRLIQHATRLDLASFEDPSLPRRAGTRAATSH